MKLSRLKTNNMIQSKTRFYIVLSAAILISVGFIVFENNASTVFSQTAGTTAKNDITTTIVATDKQQQSSSIYNMDHERRISLLNNKVGSVLCL